MARIRTIKPDALQHRKVGRLSDRAFRVWVGLLTQADDEGRLPCDPDQVAAWCFGYQRHVTLKQIEGAVQEIQSLGLISLYSANGTRYAYFPSWKDHQKIDKARPSLYPSPFDEHSTNDSRSFALEGKGREVDKKGGGKEGSVRETKDRIYADIIEDLNELGKFSYDPKSKATRDLIDSLLSEGHTIEDFWNVHQNKFDEWKDDPKMKKFLRPSTLYRKAHFDDYLGQKPRRKFIIEEDEDAKKEKKSRTG
jgi:uncharacterized phage protein (TIGR02220 family)